MTADKPDIDIDIDLIELETLCTFQCSIHELAIYFNLSEKQLLQRIKTDDACRQSIDRGTARGMMMIRKKQYELAGDGNAEMLIWLGRQILDQS